MMKFFNKLSLWDSKKEYHTSISILISILIPVIGLLFVSNQIKFKADNDGNAHGLFALAMIISLLWWGLLIIILAISF